MTPRFRMVAGPNGSGKTTLCGRLVADYSVNFYTMINADRMFAEASETRNLRTPVPVDAGAFARHLAASTYPPDVLAPFRDGRIALDDDCFRFRTARAVTTYTVSLVANFVQEALVEAGQSFSQETVFSHPSKVAALRRARRRGYRTYLYFVATETPAINAFRVQSRVRKGGHSVPADKVVSRYERSLRQIAPALPFLSRAYFWDNSGSDFRFLAEYEDGKGFVHVASRLPAWFRKWVSVDSGAS